MGLAIVSLIVLVILGALGGLFLFRVSGQAAARNEDRPGSGGDEDGSQQANLGEEVKRSVWFFLGVAAAALSMLIGAAVLVSALTGLGDFANSVVPGAFLGFILGVAGYFLGARKLGIGAVVFTVIALVLAGVVISMRGF